ncbi:YncE family protein [Flavihumibacter profundi]|jgi:YVTN family beta-propeller protein|uniref:YncE family protein n=1 Tax=Flavihumibacter profundi TaxID=2716883 RepID=UPI001CC540EF|nr:YncE family protein [Flavihumibacter profundi]MBZ5858693.1 YncE family protein [Flavihumibacter profundi]
MKKLLIISFSLVALLAMAQQKSGYKMLRTFSIASSGGWDYLAVNENKLYVSHGTQVNILDKKTGDSAGVIPNTTGVHGIAFINSIGKGYTSNGRLNSVTVFNLSDNKVITQIPTGENPDAIMYDGFTNKIITCNGRSNDLSVIDPSSQKVIATIQVGGKPETAVTNEAGKWYVNIEDKSEILQVNAQTYKVEQRWSIAPGESPTGLVYDPATKLLFAGCEKLLVVVDALTGKMQQQLPIGDGCDGVALDKEKRLVFTSNGEGTMTVIKIDKTGKCGILDNVSTKKGARTIAIDEVTHHLYLPTAEFQPLPAGATEGTRPAMKPGTFQVLVLGVN